VREGIAIVDENMRTGEWRMHVSIAGTMRYEEKEGGVPT
jgi:hypothetical protein